MRYSEKVRVIVCSKPKYSVTHEPDIDATDLRQELLENESEATSLVQDQLDYFSTDDELARRRPRPSGDDEGWLTRFLNRVLYPGAGRYESVSQDQHE